MLKFTLSLAIIFLLGSITMSQASELTEISVSIIGDSEISVDSSKLIRADVEVKNFDPAGDGFYFMKIIQLSTGKVLSETEIQPMNRGNEIWGVQIAYWLDENKVGISKDDLIGDYEMLIRTEYGTATAKTTFSILASPQSETPKSLKPQIENKTEPSPEAEPKVPDWVRNIFIWYGEEKISEDELLNAIQYLLDQGILKTK